MKFWALPKKLNAWGIKCMATSSGGSTNEGQNLTKNSESTKEGRAHQNPMAILAATTERMATTRPSNRMATKSKYSRAKPTSRPPPSPAPPHHTRHRNSDRHRCRHQDRHTPTIKAQIHKANSHLQDHLYHHQHDMKILQIVW